MTIQFSCIYQIRNILNNRIYIGSALYYGKRRNLHLNRLQFNKHHSYKLQNDYNEFGESVFVFEVLEKCEHSELLKNEQKYLNTLSPYYNISVIAGAGMLGRKHTPETKIKMSKSGYKNGVHFNTGKKRTIEERIEMGNRVRGKKHSIESIQKMKDIAFKLNAIARIDRKIQMKPIIDSLGNIFESTVAAAKFHGLAQQTVSEHANGFYKTSKTGVTFKFYKEKLCA